MILCPSCNRYSTRIYRCEYDDCGRDLVDSPTPIEPFRYRTVAGRRDDGLVDVEFRRLCTTCGSAHYVGLDYCDVHRVIRFPCDECGQPTKQRPVDEDLRLLVKRLGLDDQEVSTPDRPAIPSPA